MFIIYFNHHNRIFIPITFYSIWVFQYAILLFLLPSCGFAGSSYSEVKYIDKLTSTLKTSNCYGREKALLEFGLNTVVKPGIFDKFPEFEATIYNIMANDPYPQVAATAIWSYECKTLSPKVFVHDLYNNPGKLPITIHPSTKDISATLASLILNYISNDDGKYTEDELLLLTRNDDPRLRYWSIINYSKVDQLDKDSKTAILSSLNDQNRAVRYAGISSVYEIGSNIPEAASVLVDMIHVGNNANGAIISTLRVIGKTDEKVANKLIDILGDEEYLNIEKALFLETLGKISDSNETMDTLAKFINNSNMELAGAAIKGVINANKLNTLVCEGIKKYINIYEYTVISYYAIEAIGCVCEEENIINELFYIYMGKHGKIDEHYELAAFSSIVNMHERAIPFVKEYVYDTDNETRAKALGLLQTVDPGNEEYVELYYAALDSESEDVRINALVGLSEMPNLSPKVVEKVLQLFEGDESEVAKYWAGRIITKSK